MKTPVPAPPRTPQLDLTVARMVVDGLEASSTDGAVPSLTALADLARASGTVQVWDWLATAATESAAVGQHATTAKIFAFAYLFAEKVTPVSGTELLALTGIRPPTGDQLGTLAALAMPSLALLPFDRNIFGIRCSFWLLIAGRRSQGPRVIQLPD